MVKEIITEYFDLNQEGYSIKCKIIKPAHHIVTKTILGIHGFCGSKESDMLTKLGERAANDHGALISFDLPAHGKSNAVDDQLTIQNCLRDIDLVSKWISQTYPGVSRNLFATSFGGFLALQIFESFTDHKIILRAPAVTMPEHILMDLIEDDAETFQKRGWTEVGFNRKNKLAYAFFEDLQAHKVMDRFYDYPAMIIHGDLDEVVPRKDILKFIRNNQNFVLKAVPKAEHHVINAEVQNHIIGLSMDWYGMSAIENI